MNTPKLIFTERATSLILEALGKTVNQSGIIVDLLSGVPVLCSKGEQITPTELDRIQGKAWYKK